MTHLIIGYILGYKESLLCTECVQYQEWGFSLFVCRYCFFCIMLSAYSIGLFTCKPPLTPSQGILPTVKNLNYSELFPKKGFHCNKPQHCAYKLYTECYLTSRCSPFFLKTCFLTSRWSPTMTKKKKITNYYDVKKILGFKNIFGSR